MGEVLGVPAQKTEHVCADCGKDIAYTDEVFLLQIVRAYVDGGRIVSEAVLDNDNSFRFDPYYYCFRCWEKNYEEIRNDMMDELPIDDAWSRFECVCCGSGIREGIELLGTFTLGEFHVSERSPNGVRSPCFTQISQADMLCIYCLTLLNEGYIDMWPDGIHENNECDDCIQARCWRMNVAEDGGCPCRCHSEQPEEDEEQTATFP